MGRKTVFGIGLLGGALIAAAGLGCEVLGEVRRALADDDVVSVQCSGGVASHDIGGAPDPARLVRLRVLGILDGGPAHTTLRTIEPVRWSGTMASVDCGADVREALFVLGAAW